MSIIESEIKEVEYEAFLRSKIAISPMSGFDVGMEEINPILYPHQRDTVRWAVRGGRRAIFHAFGLGKTFMQIETLRLVQAYGGGEVLVILPLGVRQEFFRDGHMLGVTFRFIRTNEDFEEAAADGARFFLTNYESVRDGKLDPNRFRAVSLDEASVLRSYGSKTYQTFLTLFEQVPYKFVATATPSPNRYKEIIHYAGFLGIMDTGQALTRFFQRDSTQANNLTLYPHKEKEFYAWLHSWALFCQKPSDLGYDDTAYTLPPMEVIYHEVETDHTTAGIETNGQALLLKDAAMGLSQAAGEKRETLDTRISKMLEIIREDPQSHYIIWHDLEAERHAIEKALPGVRSIYGSQDIDINEMVLTDFAEGRSQYLSTKPIMSGSGCNLQRHCHKAIFLGVGYKFNDFIQACHRIHRFQQAHPCEIHIIHSEAERKIVQTLLAKWEQHNEMVNRMSEIIKDHGLNDAGLAEGLARTIGCERDEAKGDRFLLAHNDAVIETMGMEADSVDLIVTSIPFANHYEYTPTYNDFGHTDDNEHFWSQMDFLTPEMLRVLRPGRLACIHVKDRIVFGNVTGKGYPTSDYFHEETSFHMRKHGFEKVGMVTVVTDVVRENNQTYRLGWSEQSKDGTKMGVGCPEYVLIFRKPQTDRTRGYADVPVVKSKKDYTRARWQIDAHAFWRSSGDRLMTPEELAQLGPAKLAGAFPAFTLSGVYDYDRHIAIGEELEKSGTLPASFMAIAPGSHDPNVWHDVNRMLTLNSSQSFRNVQLHVCPLQFDIVDRLITRYSNKDELVFDPFCGIGTVPYRAVKLGRCGRGVELAGEYYQDSIQYLKAAEAEYLMPSLFSVEELPAEEEEAVV